MAIQGKATILGEIMKRWLAKLGEHLIRMTGGWNGQSCRHFGGWDDGSFEICDLKRGHIGDHVYRTIPNRYGVKKYLLAENRKHAVHWCKISNLRIDRDVIYVSSPRILYGLVNNTCDFIYYETWQNHPNAQEIHDMVQMIKSRSYAR